MKSLNKSVVLSLISAILAPALLLAQGASSTQVLSEDPDGAVVMRAGSSMALDAGDTLQEGDVLTTNASTVIVSICDGALITLYPGTEVVISNLGSMDAELNLKRGELLGDSISGRNISVTSVVGTTNISNGVFGVLLSSSGENWTLQVRNLDGNVTFTGADGLDSSSMAVAVVDAGTSVNVPVGEEFIARGTYNAGTDVFALSSGGAVIATMSDETTSGMRQEAGKMAAFGAAEEGAPSVDIIEIPWLEVETASGKG